MCNAYPSGGSVSEQPDQADDIEERPDIVNIQDHVAQEGQGTIADRINERLGRSDVAIILLRQIWQRAQ